MLQEFLPSLVSSSPWKLSPQLSNTLYIIYRYTLCIYYIYIIYICNINNIKSTYKNISCHHSIKNCILSFSSNKSNISMQTIWNITFILQFFYSLPARLYSSVLAWTSSIQFWSNPCAGTENKLMIWSNLWSVFQTRLLQIPVTSNVLLMLFSEFSSAIHKIRFPLFWMSFHLSLLKFWWPVPNSQSWWRFFNSLGVGTFRENFVV